MGRLGKYIEAARGKIFNSWPGSAVIPRSSKITDRISLEIFHLGISPCPKKKGLGAQSDFNSEFPIKIRKILPKFQGLPDGALARPDILKRGGM
jgi:hypothetical protein